MSNGNFIENSILVNPDGEVEMVLEDKESMLIEEISKKAISNHKRSWGVEYTTVVDF
jgi:hypothetical protein